MREMSTPIEDTKTEKVLAYVTNSLYRINEEMLACREPDGVDGPLYRNLLNEFETLQHVAYGLHWALGKRSDWPFHADS